jgi:hypothetical protein
MNQHKTANTFKTVVLRIFAIFGSGAIAAIAGGSIVGVDYWKSALIAGVMSAAKVIEALLRSWADDGVLTAQEISEAFGGKSSSETSSQSRS